MKEKISGGMERLTNRMGRVGVFCLLIVAGLILFAGCAAPAAPTTPTPESASSVTPIASTPATTTLHPVNLGPLKSPSATQSSQSAFPMVITDELGRTVTIKHAPQRIISIAPSDTEIIFALGLGDKVVGVDQYSDFPAEAKTKTNLGGYTNPSIEKIVSLSPDLIMVTSVHLAKVIPVLEAMGYTVVGLDPKTVDDVLTSITLVGKITGKTQEASDLNASLQKRINAVTDKTGKLSNSQMPRTFYIVWPDPLMSAGNATFQADLIQKAGGINVAQSLNGFQTISLESIVTANPQVMIAGTGADMGNSNFQFLMTKAELANTDARKNGKVFEVDGNLISRPGPRLVDALEQFAKIIHPELFK